MDLLATLAIILLMVAANALFVAAEFAVVGSRRSRVQEMSAADPGAARLLAVVADPARLDHFVAGCQVGITVSSLVAGAYGHARLTPLLEPHLGALGGETASVVIVLLAITSLQVVLGELLPKTVALRYPERLAIATLFPMRISLWLFTPFIAVFNGSAFAIMRRFGMQAAGGHAHVHSPEELEGLYRDSAAGGLIDADERDMVSGVLGVNRRVVREIMTPSVRVVYAHAAESVRDALARLCQTPYSRFPVLGDGPDDVLGNVHVRVLFAAVEKDPAQPVSRVMRPPLVVSDLMPVPALLAELRRARRHSATVVDEYGTVAGLVTLEDALEEVLGELQDEFDQEEEPIVQDGAVLLVRGDVLVDTLNRRFGLALPTEDADTIGGLLWHLLGRLPEAGDSVHPDPPLPAMTVATMHRRAVARVRIELPERQQ